MIDKIESQQDISVSGKRVKVERIIMGDDVITNMLDPSTNKKLQIKKPEKEKSKEVQGAQGAGVIAKKSMKILKKKAKKKSKKKVNTSKKKE